MNVVILMYGEPNRGSDQYQIFGIDTHLSIWICSDIQFQCQIDAFLKIVCDTTITNEIM